MHRRTSIFLAAAVAAALAGPAHALTADGVSCTSTGPGTGATAPIWGLTPLNDAFWDGYIGATCTTTPDGGVFSGSVVFNPYPYNTTAHMWSTACGVATGSGTLEVRLERIISAPVDPANFPIRIPINVRWAGYDQEIAGSGGTHGGHAGGSVTGDVHWVGGCPEDHFQIAGSVDVTY